MELSRYLIIFLALFVNSCKLNKEISKSSGIIDKELQDSAQKIGVTISGIWKFKESSDVVQNKIMLPEFDEVEIKNLVTIDKSEPLNYFIITAIKVEYIDSTNTMQGWYYDDSAKIEFRENQFGLYITRGDSISGFIGIAELNDSILKLANGQNYTRIK